jgi:hypothetical protein
MSDSELPPTGNPPSLADFIRLELAKPQPPAVMAAAEAAKERFGEHALAVLFYGSCLRTGQVEDRILDFYIIVDDYRSAYGSGALAAANRILPPNVFYAQTRFGERTIRSKIAVLSLQDFIDRAGPRRLNISIWARFSQPSALLCAANLAVSESLLEAIAEAVKTMICAALPLVPEVSGPKEVWQKAFELTYSAELRSEGSSKGAELYALDRARYDAITPLIFRALEGVPSISPGAARRRWLWRRANGKCVSFLRLVKAAFTFEGGVDYLAWKIRRHSGVEIEIKPWQRRHPILAGFLLFLHLRLKGAFR